VSVPGASPVTIPAVMIAIAVFPLAHAPPGVGSVIGKDWPTHKCVGGNGGVGRSTLSETVVQQPVGAV